MKEVVDGLHEGVRVKNHKLHIEAGTIALFFTDTKDELLEQMAAHHGRIVDEMFPLLLTKINAVLTPELEQDIESVSFGTKKFIRSVLSGEDPTSKLLIRVSDYVPGSTLQPKMYCHIQPAVEMMRLTGEVVVYTQMYYRRIGPKKDTLIAARSIASGRHFGRKEAVIRPLSNFP